MSFSRRMLVLVVSLFTMVMTGNVFAQEHHGQGEMMPAILPIVGPDVTIRFVAQVASQPVACGMIYDAVGASASTLSINDYRFYVSNVRLLNVAGEEVPVELAQDGLWQYENVALLDFEDGTNLCAETGTPDMNNKIIGTVPEGEYNGIVFDLGLPFELNHLDSAAAPAPLNVPAMWWNWQYGYKFARIDLQTPSSTTPQWFIHLGSTGCDAPDGATAPTVPCSNPNVATVRLENFDPVRNFIVSDLATLLSEVNLDESIPMPPGCMSGPDDTDCTNLFPGFGLDLLTGAPVEGNLQTFFAVN